MEANTTEKPLRLMSASLCRATGSVIDQLLGMRKRICEFNAGAGVRSALLYSEGWLLQWHEGPANVVEEAWRLPAANCDQGPLRTIHRSVGPHGLIDSLHIVTLHSGEKARDVARRLRRVEREYARGLSAEPAAIWNRLSAPSLAASAEGTDARRDVVVVASEYNASVELIKALAERYRATVGYQRLADCDFRSGDVGAAYVDLSDQGGIIRVNALSRRALTNSMVKLSLRNVECMVLLLGTRPRPAGMLAASVAVILNSAAARPAISLIGPSPAIGAHAAELFATLPGIQLQDIRASASLRASLDAVLSVITTKKLLTGPDLALSDRSLP